MGILHIEGRVRGPGGKEQVVRLLVDSGATYSLLPQAIWQAIDLEPKREMSFSLADGTILERKVSECYISLPQGEGHSPVILGEANDVALLGVVTLENLGLVFNPFSRTLLTMKMMLA